MPRLEFGNDNHIKAMQVKEKIRKLLLKKQTLSVKNEIKLLEKQIEYLMYDK